MWIARYILNKPPEPTYYACKSDKNENGEDYVVLGPIEEATRYHSREALFAGIGSKSAHAFKAERLLN